MDRRLVRRLTRRKFVATVGVSCLSVGAYGKLVEPEWLEVTEHTVPLSGSALSSSGGTKLLHMSDLHASAVVGLEYLDHAIQAGLALKPDVVCLTGDFITAQYGYFDSYSRILTKLSDAVPTFACLGNHDGGRWAAKNDGYPDSEKVRDLLEKSRIELLLNRAVVVSVRGKKFNLVGTGDVWAGHFDSAQAFAATGRVENVPTIVLVHNPDAKDDLVKYSWDLLLCGHTHGGQLYVPLLGTPFAPVRDQRYVQGLHRWQNRWLHVTKGVGNVHGIRLNCRPEVCLLHLT